MNKKKTMNLQVNQVQKIRNITKAILKKVSTIEQGTEFSIREGGRTVGAGKVTKIVE